MNKGCPKPETGKCSKCGQQRKIFKWGVPQPDGTHEWAYPVCANCVCDMIMDLENGFFDKNEEWRDTRWDNVIYLKAKELGFSLTKEEFSKVMKWINRNDDACVLMSDDNIVNAIKHIKEVTPDDSKK